LEESGISCNLWLGGYQEPVTTDDPRANWVWVTREPFSSYQNWLPSEPNDWYGPASEQHLTISHVDWDWNEEGHLPNVTGYVAESVPLIVEVIIDIKPSSYPNSITPRSKGKIPVAILSSMDFDAPTVVDTESLTFGPTGDDESLSFCSPSSEDVNDDGYDDLVCHFYTQMTGFECGDDEGILKGQTIEQTPVEGSDSVRIVPSACRYVNYTTLTEDFDDHGILCRHNTVVDEHGINGKKNRDARSLSIGRRPLLRSH